MYVHLSTWALLLLLHVMLEIPRRAQRVRRLAVEHYPLLCPTRHYVYGMYVLCLYEVY